MKPYLMASISKIALIRAMPPTDVDALVHKTLSAAMKNAREAQPLSRK